MTTSAAAARPRLMVIAPADYDSSVRKGVSELLQDFDEQGFFEAVHFAFPFTHHTRQHHLSDCHVVHEYGLDWFAPTRNRRWLRRLMAPLHLLRTSLALRDLARKEEINIIRSTDPCFSGLFALIVARLSGKPFCVSLHADYDKRYELDGAAGAPTLMGSRRLALLIERFVLARADRVLPIRESLSAYALRHGAKPERIRVIPHGADLSLFTTPQQELPVPRDGRAIVSFAGRLSKENYLDDILAAAAILGVARQDFRLVIAGGGAEEARLRKKVATDPVLRRCVEFTGFISRAAVAALRQESVASICTMAGFSLIEACAAGSAIVAYDVEWHSELVRDGETGFLVPEHDTATLARRIGQLLDDPAQARTFGVAARDLAVARHSLAAASANKRRHYAEWLAEAGSRPAASREHDPNRAEWYSDDQFHIQCDHAATRAVVEGRWRLFAQALRDWRGRNKPSQDRLRILDAGCGDGINLQGLQQIVLQQGLTANFLAIDYNPKRIERAGKLGIASLTIGSLTALPYPDSHFDMVLCNHVIEHIPEKAAALAELCRVLRPGGLIVVGVPNEGCLFARLRNNVLQRSILRTTDHVHFFTATSLDSALTASGVKVRLVAREGFFMPHMALGRLFGRIAIGRMAMEAMGRLLPSQSAGLIAIGERPPH
ncbi:MAG: glycosyltransferase [Ferrovibrio sp.]|nr:glycosyltransferase [Ferrovibrio sp.]